ncbi:hypothetical protein [Kamptonema formosum]|nr:hypothetical protein [Oscillatoria sp. PCC 10802]
MLLASGSGRVGEPWGAAERVKCLPENLRDGTNRGAVTAIALCGDLCH